MKKVLFFAAAVAISFASCCGNQPAQATDEEVDVIEVVEAEEAAPIVEEEIIAEEAAEIDAEVAE